MTLATFDFEVVGRGTVHGELALPPGTEKAGAVIVVHEWWGLNDEIRRQCDRFASEGFLALAVDLYRGQVTDDAARAFELSNEMKTADAIVTIAAARAAIAAHSRTNGRVAVTGFCLGGAMAMAAAFQVDGLAAAVPFYGATRDEFITGAPRCPVQGHFAKSDAFVNADRVRAITERAHASGADMSAFFYDGGHAFLRDDPATYHEESAKLAWSRAVAFLRDHLGR